MHLLHGHSNRLAILQSTAWEYCSASEIASALCASLMWLPGKAGRQGTALPFHSQRLAAAPPCSACWSSVCLPSMPAVEQLDTFTHNLPFRASHPHLQLCTTYTTGLMPGTQPQRCSSPHLNMQHPNMSSHSTQLQFLTGCQPCLCVPGTQPLPPLHTPRGATPACRPCHQCSQDW